MVFEFGKNKLLHFAPEMLTCQIGEGMFSWIKNNKEMLKDMRGVYYYISNDETIYIGKAKDLYQRMMHHCKEMLPHLCTEVKRKKDKKWIDGFSEFADEEVEVEDDARRVATRQVEAVTATASSSDEDDALSYFQKLAES